MSTLLPPDWSREATPAALADLDLLIERYAHPAPTLSPGPAGLRAAALRLQQPAPTNPAHSFWKQVKAWLHRRLAPAGAILKWFRSLPSGAAGPRLQEILLLGAILVVPAFIILALWAGGILRGGDGKPSAARRRPVAMREMAVDGNVGGVDPARSLDRPVSALRMLIEALRRSRRIGQDGNLTCREIVTSALFDSQGQREDFAGIALLAERELYGPRGMPIRVPDELKPALQALYTELSVPVAGSAASS